MSTSDPPRGSVPSSASVPDGSLALAGALTSAISALANELFRSPDLSASPLTASPAGGAPSAEGASLAPPGGGALPTAAVPPAPAGFGGPPVSPPPPAVPSSLESHAQPSPPVAAPENLSVVDATASTLSGSGGPAVDAPYFLSIAGMPGAASSGPETPRRETSGRQTPSSLDAFSFEVPSFGGASAPSAAPTAPSNIDVPSGPGALPIAAPGAPTVAAVPASASGVSPADASPAGASPAGASPAGASPAGASPAGASPAGGSPTGASLPSTGPAIPSSDSFASGLYEFSPEVVSTASSAQGSTAAPGSRSSAGLFDPYAVKRDFPILRERVRGRPLVWLDNAATTQKPQAVIDRLSYFYEHENSNVHRAAHTLAARSTDAYEGAREKVRRFINAPSAKEIVFVRGTTEGINLIAQSWGRRYVGAGDEIVISWLEHHANIVPWQMLCAEKGAKLKVAPVDSRGEIILEEYEKLLGPRTRLVSFTQVSNALGTVTPAKQMIEMAHRHGACVLLDGAQAVSHMPVDVQALGCDFYVLSGHKVFAPTGIGAVFGRTEVLEAMPPWQGGGNMIADVTFERTVYQGPPSKFEAGTGNIADAVGLGAALDYLTSLGLPNVSRHEHELRIYAEGCLAQIPGLRIIGNAREKAGVVSFVLEGIPTEQVGGMLDQEGIAVRSGHHCAQPILRRFGLEATVRASLAPYNTRDDIDALVAAVRRIVSGTPAAAAR